MGEGKQIKRTVKAKRKNDIKHKEKTGQVGKMLPR